MRGRRTPPRRGAVRDSAGKGERLPDPVVPAIQDHSLPAAKENVASISAAAPATPDPAASFAAKATDLQALSDTVGDAATVSGGLWLSYIFAFFYLAIAAGAVTHTDLFLESPVKLPFLNVDLPLLGFFVLGPLLFLVVHAYTLLHFSLLAGKIGAFDDALRIQVTDEDVRARLRRQLPSNIFVQFLAGPREVRAGAIGLLLRGIAWLSLVIGPVSLLVFFQLQFLPFHSWPISWWQRLAVLLDLLLLWLLWPPVARGTTTSLRWCDFRRGSVLTCLAASLVPVLLVFAIATFPGEWLEEKLPPVRYIPISWALKKWASPHELLLGGGVDPVTQRPTSFWSNRLLLARIDVIDHAKLDSDAKISAISVTVSLRGRPLEGAVLDDADLRKADFTGARLQGASFWNAHLQGARFFRAQLQGALFDGAHLQGAQFLGAQLQGAEFVGAQLQGASFSNAQLQGASLSLAQLQGAYLGLAQLQGTSLDHAHLQGASLGGAQLEGASLLNAQLQGSSLDGAQLQGASLDGAGLQSAALDHVFVWRAKTNDANFFGSRIVAPELAPKYSPQYIVERKAFECPQMPCDWSPETFANLKWQIEMQVPQGRARERALTQIARLDPNTRFDWKPGGWVEQQPRDYERNLTKSLRTTGCDREGAPYVISGIVDTLAFDRRFSPRSVEVVALAKAFLDEANCPGAHGLSETYKAKLEQIRDGTPSSSAVPPPPPAFSDLQ